MCEVTGRLLSDQPLKSRPSRANNLLDAFHQVLADITAFHKTVVTFTFLLTPFLCAAPLTAIIGTLCLPAQGQLSFSSRIYLWRQAYLSVHVLYLLMDSCMVIIGVSRLQAC